LTFSRLTDPKVIFVSTIAGGILGWLVPSAGLILKPFGDLYIAALSISIVPLMMTALISGVGRMLRNPTLRNSFPRFAVVYVATLLVPAVIAVVVGLLLAPGADLGADAIAKLGRQLSTSASPQSTAGLLDFLIAIIPSNIFRALSAQNFAAIVIFSLLLGIGLGMADTAATDDTLNVMHSLYVAFSRIFEWIMKGLAVGLFCLVAGVTATVDTTLFTSLIGFIGAYYCAGIALLAVYTLLLVSLRRIKGVRSLGGLRGPLTISFLANNPFIAIRPAIESLVNRFGVQDDEANAVLPFGIIASQHGQIIKFILLTMFLANVYGIHFSATQVTTLIIGSIIGGTAVVGGGAALAPALAPILGSVGVPGDLGLVVLTATDQIIGPMVSLMTVFSAVTLVLVGRAAPASGRIVEPTEARSEAKS
jgi:Na+/H+-dicarboxylate symporter